MIRFGWMKSQQCKHHTWEHLEIYLLVKITIYIIPDQLRVQHLTAVKVFLITLAVFGHEHYYTSEYILKTIANHFHPETKIKEIVVIIQFHADGSLNLVSNKL